jgi:hypothetical protein
VEQLSDLIIFWGADPIYKVGHGVFKQFPWQTISWRSCKRKSLAEQFLAGGFQAQEVPAFQVIELLELPRYVLLHKELRERKIPIMIISRSRF